MTAVADMVRIDMQSLTAPLYYVGDAGCMTQRDPRGQVTVVGPWEWSTRRMLQRAQRVMDLVPDLPRASVAHWAVTGLSEQHLLVMAAPAGYTLVRAECDLTIDDVSGITVSGPLRLLTRTAHEYDIDALAEHFARLRCALEHMAAHTP